MTLLKPLCTLLLIVGLGATAPLASAAEDGPKAGAKEEKHDAMPAGTKGVSEGEIVSKEKGKLVLKTKDGNLLFMAHWRGGNPQDGGGLDKETLGKLEHFKAGDHVKIAWTWEERRRIESIEAVK
jgi:hypothetical protein